MVINDPETLREVTDAFERYETALTTNDVEALDSFFWNDDRALRYGAAENLYGYAAIQQFRAARKSGSFTRTFDRLIITTYGKDYATASLHHHPRNAPGKVGRQMQTWARLPEGWRIVAAHVSTIDDPDV
ncbi:MULTISPECIES: oxalurate catabolism protein HpxZ [unclassified Beijerinckia]|uniref:oxalurate catabolism protein HpxZ n=1 Tax=unclassified Beijerinckia TaxID=2638183 RepID=UPI000899D9FF|nr:MULTISPECIES: oxalurate catabolism protein HpxZ [unclassified Beijerinckia]MDH7799767.1 hypothetical protein [Beijerinckia sp. GAS462]SED36629.1 Protein of unknown function [Beijerinckia sp. 28-YEA-48]